MYEIELKIPCDLCGRKAAYFVQEITNNIKNNIYCRKDSREVNSKSLLGILSLGIKKDDNVFFKVEKEKDIANIQNILKNIL